MLKLMQVFKKEGRYNVFFQYPNMFRCVVIVRAFLLLFSKKNSNTKEIRMRYTVNNYFFHVCERE